MHICCSSYDHPDEVTSVIPFSRLVLFTVFYQRSLESDVSLIEKLTFISVSFNFC